MPIKTSGALKFTEIHTEFATRGGNFDQKPYFSILKTHVLYRVVRKGSRPTSDVTIVVPVLT